MVNASERDRAAPQSKGLLDRVELKSTTVSKLMMLSRMVVLLCMTDPW